MTLPNAVDKTNGRREGKTVIWLVERATCKDAEDFARQLGDVWEARCPSKNIKITPSNPARLGLAPFNALATGANGSTGSSLDTNQIVAAAKFVPYGLVVTRSVDLTGNSGMPETTPYLLGRS